MIAYINVRSVILRMNDNSPAKEELEMAQKAYDENDFEKSIRYLYLGFEKDSANKLLYRLMVRCLEDLGEEEEAELFNVVMQNFKNANEFYELGYYFSSNGDYRLAIPFLQRANKLSPQDNEIALELAMALVAQFRPKEAQEALQSLEDNGEFWIAYEYLWCSLLLNKRKGIKEFISFTKKKFSEANAEEKEELEGYFVAINKLEECYNRLCMLDNLKCKPLNPIQQWQFVQYGGAILDYYEDITVAGGRYVVLKGQYSSVNLILKKVTTMLDRLDRKPNIVIALEDASSIILAKALAKMLNIKCEVINYENIKLPSSLVVVSCANELCSYDDYDFKAIEENQTLFAFYVNWLSDCCTAPDITGLMAKNYFFPWEDDGISLDSDEEEEMELSDEQLDEIVGNILSQNIEIGAAFDEILSFYLELKTYIKGAEKAGCRRIPFSTDSPIKGAY